MKVRLEAARIFMKSFFDIKLTACRGRFRMNGYGYDFFVYQQRRHDVSDLVAKVDGSNWETEVLKTSQLVMVDFWAVWCGPCQMVAPIVDELAKEYQGKLKVMKLNTDEAPEVAGQYQIMSIPTIVFFKGGQVVDKIVGARPKQQFKEKIESLLAQSATA
jgi:thioredoxin 1